MIYLILDIESFEQQRVIIKGLLQLERPKNIWLSLEFKKLLSNSEMYEHRCLENIKKLYKYSGKSDEQQHYKAIIEAAMVYNLEGFIDNSPISPSQFVTVKNPSAGKSLRQFLYTLEVKYNTAI